FSSRRRHTRFSRDWSSDVCSSDLPKIRRQNVSHGWCRIVLIILWTSKRLIFANGPSCTELAEENKAYYWWSLINLKFCRTGALRMKKKPKPAVTKFISYS